MGLALGNKRGPRSTGEKSREVLPKGDEKEIALHLVKRRNNVRQVIFASVILYALMIPIVLIGNYYHCFRLESREIIVILFGDMLVGTLFLLRARTVLRESLEEEYQWIYLAFWGVVSAQFMYLAQHTVMHEMGMVLFLGMVMVLGGVPYLTLKERLLYVAVSCLFLGSLVWRHQFEVNEVACLGTWSMFGLWIAKVRYKSYVRECQQSRELKHALMDAETDPMTGLLNRRGLSRSLYSVIPYCIREELSVAVIMIDIDNFKRYNDTFGHLEGDECIKSVARVIQTAVRRKTDYAARVGGEEFLIFLTGLDESAAVKWAMKVQENIKTLAIPHARDNFSPIVTVSMGIHSTTLKTVEEFELLRDEADMELYNAKENGRDCLSIKGTCYESKIKKMCEENFILLEKEA